MNHINGKPIAPTDVRLAINWKPTPDLSHWEFPVTASLGFLSLLWETPDVTIPGVPPASVNSTNRNTPPLDLSKCVTMEDQLFMIIAAVYDSNDVRGQLGADEYIPPVIPPAPPYPETEIGA